MTEELKPILLVPHTPSPEGQYLRCEDCSRVVALRKRNDGTWVLARHGSPRKCPGTIPAGAVERMTRDLREALFVREWVELWRHPWSCTSRYGVPAPDVRAWLIERALGPSPDAAAPRHSETILAHVFAPVVTFLTSPELWAHVYRARVEELTAGGDS